MSFCQAAWPEHLCEANLRCCFSLALLGDVHGLDICGQFVLLLQQVARALLSVLDNTVTSEGNKRQSSFCEIKAVFLE